MRSSRFLPRKRRGTWLSFTEFFVYQQAFTQGDFGFGAMLGVVLFVLVALITAIVFVLGRIFVKDA